eukprot:9150394-Pyramimonas_sp.AAC.1
MTHEGNSIVWHGGAIADDTGDDSGDGYSDVGDGDVNADDDDDDDDGGGGGGDDVDYDCGCV